MPGLLGAPVLLVLACLLKDPALPWSDVLFLNPGLLGMPGLLGIPGLCLKEMFCLLFCWLSPSLFIGAPTSSGGDILLLIFFVVDLFEFWSGLFDILPPPSELEMFWEDLLELTLLLIFLGLAISWIGGFPGLLIGGGVLLWKFFLSRLTFWEVLLFIFWFVRFGWDCEMLAIVGLLRVLGWFEIIFILSGLLRGFFNNGFLFGLSLRGFPCIEEVTEDLTSLLCLELSSLIEGFLIESIFLSEFFLLIRFFIFSASPALIELLWLLTEIESFWAASNISLLSRFKSLESS